MSGPPAMRWWPGRMRRAGISPWWAPKVLLQLAAILWAGWSALAAPPGPAQDVAWIAGAVLLLAGGACELWHYVVLKRASPRVGETATLLTHGGLYRVVLHPMYLGDAIMVLGAAWMAGNLAAVALAGVFAWALASLVQDEEELLRERFGGEFEGWEARTARLVPGVW